MKVSDQLNLVSKVKDSNGKPAHIHIRPLSYEVVEENCILLGNLFSQFFSLVGTVGAPRVAAMMLRKRLQHDRAMAGEIKTGPDLMDEMRRMATVIHQTENGYKSTPLTTALSQGIISEEEFRDVEGELVFFMVTCALQRAELMEVTVGKSLKMYSAQLSSLSVTEWRDSLPKLTEEKVSTDAAEEPEKSSPVDPLSAPRKSRPASSIPS